MDKVTLVLSELFKSQKTRSLHWYTDGYTTDSITTDKLVDKRGLRLRERYTTESLSTLIKWQSVISGHLLLLN